MPTVWFMAEYVRSSHSSSGHSLSLLKHEAPTTSLQCAANDSSGLFSSMREMMKRSAWSRASYGLTATSK